MLSHYRHWKYRCIVHSLRKTKTQITQKHEALVGNQSLSLWPWSCHYVPQKYQCIIRFEAWSNWMKLLHPRSIKHSWNWSLSLWQFAMVMYLSQKYHCIIRFEAWNTRKTGWSCRYATQKHEALVATGHCRCDHGAVIMYPRSINVSFVSKHEATGWSCCIPEASSTRWKLVIVAVTVCHGYVSIIVSFVSKHETLVAKNRMKLSLCNPEAWSTRCETGRCRCDHRAVVMYPRSIVVLFISKHEALVAKPDEAVASRVWNRSLSLWQFGSCHYVSQKYRCIVILKHEVLVC